MKFFANKSFLFFVFFSFYIFANSAQSFAFESTSTSYKINDSVFESGSLKDSTNFSSPGGLSPALLASYAINTLPLTPGTITSCGKIFNPGTYTLTSDLNGITGPCFYIKANGVTIEGAGFSVRSKIGNTGYAVVATSSLSVDATSSAFTNLNIKNIKFENFEHGFMGRGLDVVGGVGGNGASTTFNNVTIPDIDVSGGDPEEQAGNGGIVRFETSVADAIYADGGNSTQCGIPGDGGDIYISTDSVVGTTTNDGGNVSGCTRPRGQRGHILAFVSSYTLSHPPSTNTNTSNVSRGNSNFDPFGGVSNVLPEVVRLVKLKLAPIISFGDETAKNAFSFVSSFDRFLFTPMPTNVKNILQKSPSLENLLTTSGIKYEKDLVALKKKPILLSGTNADIAGLFKVSTKALPVKKDGKFELGVSYLKAYIGSDSKNSLVETIYILPKTDLTISLNSKVEDTEVAIFDGKKVSFTKNGDALAISLKTPARAGSYLLTTSRALVPLQIVVLDQNQENPSNSLIEAPKKSLLDRVVDGAVGAFQVIHTFFQKIFNF